jgi:hypothetical protein
MANLAVCFLQTAATSCFLLFWQQGRGPPYALEFCAAAAWLFPEGSSCCGWQFLLCRWVLLLWRVHVRTYELHAVAATAAAAVALCYCC